MPTIFRRAMTHVEGVPTHRVATQPATRGTSYR